MIIHIEKREDPFVRIDKKALGDSRLTWRAKGILCYLLSKPPKWKVMMGQLVEASKEGRDAVRKSMAELRELGYAHLRPTKEGSEWVIYEDPRPDPWLEKERQKQKGKEAAP